MSFASLRADLDRSGFTSQFVVLPGDDLDAPPLEGAFRVELTDAAYEVQCVDYGQARVIGRSTDADGACEIVRAFLRRPIAAPRDVPGAELSRLRRTCPSSPNGSVPGTAAFSSS